MLIRWSGFGMISAFVLIAGMLLSTYFLRPILLQSMALHPAAYVANGIGLVVAAVANLVVASVLNQISKQSHSFMGIGMRGWSLLGVVCGAALIAYGYFS